jgi:zinc transport system permease protein
LVAVAVAGIIILLGRQKTTPIDSILGLLHHGALALGVIATALLKGPSVDLVGYLFGDVFAVTPSDLGWVAGGGVLVLAALAWLWPSLIRMGVHAELAEAEGVPTARARILFTLLLALTIAVAMKIVGILLVIAFLIVPAVAARPLSATPERMAVLTALVAAVSVVAGIGASTTWDTPGGPSIVLVMAVLAGLSLGFAAWRREA